ncbi:MAG: hypothetical protein NZ529_07675 [Cytophagaceae bacterium]|nr:hypothetical protein [Cytophagaceae bacterium]MDW8456664.1 hypothetical protein [Cytophagaceae bacterium]
MKWLAAFFLLTLSHTYVCAQKQPTPLALSNKAKIAKEWSIVKYEMFGVQSLPDSSQINDKIHLKPDMTFVLIERGKKITGKWSVHNAGEWMFLHVSSPKTETRNFKIISVDDKEAVIEYKDPDLVKTKYFLKALQ